MFYLLNGDDSLEKLDEIQGDPGECDTMLSKGAVRDRLRQVAMVMQIQQISKHLKTAQECLSLKATNIRLSLIMFHTRTPEITDKNASLLPLK